MRIMTAVLVVVLLFASPIQSMAEETELQTLKELLAQDLKFKADLATMEAMFTQEVFLESMEKVVSAITKTELEIVVEETESVPDGLTIDHLKNLLSHLEDMPKDSFYDRNGIAEQIVSLEVRIAKMEFDEGDDYYSPITEMPDVILDEASNVGILDGTLVDADTGEMTSVTIREGFNFNLEIKCSCPREFEGMALISGGTENSGAEIYFPGDLRIAFRINGSIVLEDGACMFPITRNMGWHGTHTIKLVRTGVYIDCFVDNRYHSKIRYEGPLRFTNIGERPDGSLPWDGDIYWAKLSDSSGERFNLDFGIDN